MFILHNRKIRVIFAFDPTPHAMKKTIALLLSAALLLTAARPASAQSTEPSKENFPSTETTLSQIGQAEAHPNAKHSPGRPTPRPSPPR